VCVAGYREQLLKIVQESGCNVLTFDLTGIKILPSGMLGLLVTMRNRGQSIELLNPSVDIQEVLRVTRLLTLFSIRPPV
jgi:anti-sigma B factor antagonist